MMRQALFLIIFVILLNACNITVPSNKLDLPIAIQNEIKNKIAKGKILLYYHSGDCSFCYGTIQAISKKFPDIPLVSISSSKDVTLVNYYLEQIDFKGISLSDSTLQFLKNNYKLLNEQKIFLIDLQYKILAGGSEFNQNTIEKVSRAIR